MAFPFTAGMAAGKGEPDKSNTEKVTSALPFFSSDAVMVIRAIKTLPSAAVCILALKRTWL